MGEGAEVYSFYVGIGDSIVWEEDRWKVVKPGPESLGKPLLVVKKIEDRLMNLELWDPDGKGKIVLNLLKSSEVQAPINIVQSFKFLGARTRTQFVFEIDKERMLLSPHDWLLLTKERWIKLTTAEEIDAYVERTSTGPLFVFNEVERKDDHLSLIGALYNAARTDVQQVEIPLQQGNGSGGQTGMGKDDKGTAGKRRGAHQNHLRPRGSPNLHADMDGDEDDDDEDDDDEDDDDF